MPPFAPPPLPLLPTVNSFLLSQINQIILDTCIVSEIFFSLSFISIDSASLLGTGADCSL